MARTALTVTASPSPYPTAGVAATFDVADTVNQNSFVYTGREIVVIWNTHGVTTYTYTITAANDALGRAVNIGPTNLAAGAMVVIGPFTPQPGWVQSDGKVYLEANNAAVKFAVITY